MTDLTPDIERVLSEHQFVPSYPGSPSGICAACHDPRLRDMVGVAIHRAHLAEQIAALVEQREEAARREAAERAWDEGLRTGLNFATFDDDEYVVFNIKQHPNPYRAGERS